MKIVFMGTQPFAATILQNIVGIHDVKGVFTRPDAVRGRGRKLVPTPVKQVAQTAGIDVYTPAALRDPIVIDIIHSLDPDVICVAAYGAILPGEVLSIPRFGCLNVHASLLPRWRGAAPIERAILAGDREAGVCIMRMETGLDTGDYCMCRSTEIDSKTSTELSAELADLGSQALLTALGQMEAGTVSWTSQDDAAATYADKIEKGEFFVRPSDAALRASARVQASARPHPARCVVASRHVTLLRVRPVLDRDMIESMHLKEGRAMLSNKRLYLGCSDGAIEVVEIQPDGKKPMDARSFAAGIQNIKSGVVSWEGLDG